MGIAFYIIVVHWIADFIFQPEELALAKSTSVKALLGHTIIYSIMWTFFAGVLFSSECDSSAFGYCVDLIKVSEFILITFVIHTITDYFTSKIVKRRFDSKYYGSPIPNFGAFTIIGFDQVLHYAQLFGTYYLLTK